jgi:hypothetical protein
MRDGFFIFAQGSLRFVNQGAVFTATNTSMTSPQYFDVANWDKLFYRLVTP